MVVLCNITGLSHCNSFWETTGSTVAFTSLCLVFCIRFVGSALSGSVMQLLQYFLIIDPTVVIRMSNLFDIIFLFLWRFLISLEFSFVFSTLYFHFYTIPSDWQCLRWQFNWSNYCSETGSFFNISQVKDNHTSEQVVSFCSDNIIHVEF